MAWKEVIPPVFRGISDFSNGLAYVCLNKWGVINTSGKVIVDFAYEDIENIEIKEEKFSQSLMA